MVFTYKDYRDHARVKIARVPALEFIDRFLLHVLPRHVRRIRNYGFLVPESAREEAAADPQAAGAAGSRSATGRTREPLQEENSRTRLASAPAAPAAVSGVCHTGVLLVITWPRPTIAQIMQLPLGPAAAVPAAVPVTER